MNNGTLDLTKSKKEPKTKKRTYAKLGYSKLEAAELVDALNKLLANYSVHYQKLRNFHWNVKGGDFFDLHEKFEDQYNNAKVAVDDIAERIRVFGQTPFSTMKDYLHHADIQEAGTDLTSLEMVREILKDYQHLLESMYRVIDITIENGDSGTEDMIKGFVKNIEKNHWMLTAFAYQG